MKNYLIILGIVLFVLGPIAKINNWPVPEIFLAGSLTGLILLTLLAIKKKA
ncbi:hypothetical protein [Pedobacter sp. MW01-1-1]|uniref:hypothetical protein n=1 Tax=Pedobacter sp. MW01-1-1 TaxID=3383027 RepID=UPI003FEE0C87